MFIYVLRMILVIYPHDYIPSCVNITNNQLMSVEHLCRPVLSKKASLISTSSIDKLARIRSIHLYWVIYSS